MQKKSRTKWMDRHEIQKVTLDWVKTNYKLTPREHDLLKIIYDRKLVRRDHLEVLSRTYRDMDTIHRARILNRSLLKMYRGMIIDKIHEKQQMGRGNLPATVSLDRGGSLLLGVPHRRRIIHKEETFKNEKIIQRYLPSNYPHINGVNKLEVDTILLLKDTDYILSMWEHEKPAEFYYGQEKVSVIPDVTCRIDVKDKPLFLFLEYDTGSENLRYKDKFPILLDKIKKYRKYKVSNLWVEKYNKFPTLLLITEDSKRIPYFNEKCREHNIFGFGVYHESYVKFITHLINMI